jgi:hypothetical protein
MKKLKLILITALCSASMIALAQDASKVSSPTTSDKKMLIGVGLSSDLSSAIGANVKFDYLVSDKFSIGVRGMFHFGSFEDYTFTDGGGKGVTVDYSEGRNFNFGINASYYILNTNKIGDKKHSLHVDLGLGFVSHGMFNKVTSSRAVTDPEYYTYKNYSGSNSLALTPGLGYEYSLGKGKLFLDIFLPFEVWGTDFTNYSEQVWGTSFNGGGTTQYGGQILFDTNRKGSQGFGVNTLFANLGYQFYF